MATYDPLTASVADPATEPIVHRVSLAQRDRRLVTVRTVVPPGLAAGTRIVLPTWTPGSYLVRDHVRHLRTIAATDDRRLPIPLDPEGISSWRFSSTLEGRIEVVTEWYADERSLRTTHVDDRHALIVGAATFPCIEAARRNRQIVRFDHVAPPARIHSTLPALGPDGFVADCYDDLADAAFEVGAHATAVRDVDGVPHRVVWASSDPPGATLDDLTEDLAAVARTAAGLLGRAPLDHGYTVLVVDGAPGGLEHRDGTTVSLPRVGPEAAAGRARSATLLAHEYLHLWNGRRLSPRGLREPALDRPAPTPSLWVVEGWTSYFDLLITARAGLLDLDGLLEALARRIDRVHEHPGVRVQSLRDASWTAWTKQYRPDADTPNTSTDYYVHGAVVAFELDLALRTERPDGDGLDDVLRLLWRRHADGPGYDEDDVLDAFASVGGDEVAARADRLVGTPGPPDPIPLLGAVGLRAVRHAGTRPDLGVILAPDGDEARVATVLDGGAAWRGGLLAGDRVLRIDEQPVDRARLPDVLAGVPAGARLHLEVEAGGRRRHIVVVPDPPRAHLVLEPDPDGAAPRARWLADPTTGSPLASAEPPTTR